jgi:hypothetical protein
MDCSDGSFAVSVVVIDQPVTGEANDSGSGIYQDHSQGDIEGAIVEGTVRPVDRADFQEGKSTPIDRGDLFC